MNTEDTPWITASDTGTSCVRFRRHQGKIEIGDTKDPEGSVLAFTQKEIDIFLQGVDSGVFDEFRSH
jgi:hypothetical protein